MAIISIITVNYNNRSGLLNTINSVFEQTISKDKIEYIVVDGGSEDGSDLLIKEMMVYAPCDFKFVSECDRGVYDAMNKGIEMASDEGYFIFMNSGDVFCSRKVLEYAYKKMKDDGFFGKLYYGDKYNNAHCLEKAFKPNSLKFGIINACHQSIFYKKLSVRYNLKYKLFSDYDFTCEYYNIDPNFKYLDMAISTFEGGGLSSFHNWNTKKEIYQINLKKFGMLNFIRFLFVKMLRIMKINHLLFVERHK
ncbi:glycosyltransferase [Vibrio cholerae]|nr:glycosyltransferase [Vibrio cholerae]EGR4421135.1 glycosyltransferase [Vibrio cholerae]EGR4432035.1 glycosyltransferase [Vibrio cholerae]HAS5578479.1 glycosyltransferase [Vibrio cholerae]